MFILFRQDPFSDGLMGLRVYFDSSDGIGNGSAGSAKQDFCRRVYIETKEKFVKSSILYDVADGKINTRGQA